MHATVFNEHDIARLPFDAPPIVNVMAGATNDKEAGAVQMAVLLPETARSESFDVGFDRLSDAVFLRADNKLAEMLRSALPGKIP